SGAILDSPSRGADQRRLAALLRPGLAVLDVGCGTGAITRGIAEAVGPDGRAVGVDVNTATIEGGRPAPRRPPPRARAGVLRRRRLRAAVPRRVRHRRHGARAAVARRSRGRAARDDEGAEARRAYRDPRL